MVLEVLGHDEGARVVFDVGGDAGEEELVVVGHGGVVEDVSLGGLTGGLDGDLLGCLAVMVGS